MSAEEECKGRKNAERYEIALESVKKNNELDHENTLSELRIKNAKLEEEKRLAESEAEFWKNKFEELSERLLLVEKGVNSFVNGDAHVGIGGKAEDLSNIRGNTHPGVFDEVMDEKDMNVNDICDNEQGNTTAGSSPSQREDLKSENTHVSTAEVSRQSPDSPNKALLGASDPFEGFIFMAKMDADYQKFASQSQPQFPRKSIYDTPSPGATASQATPVSSGSTSTTPLQLSKEAQSLVPPANFITGDLEISDEDAFNTNYGNRSFCPSEKEKGKASADNVEERDPGMSKHQASTRVSDVPSLLAITKSPIPPPVLHYLKFITLTHSGSNKVKLEFVYAKLEFQAINLISFYKTRVLRYETPSLEAIANQATPVASGSASPILLQLVEEAQSLVPLANFIIGDLGISDEDAFNTYYASPLSLAYWSNAFILGLSPSPSAALPSSLPSRLCHIKATNAFASCNSDVCY
ncbi:hypothetical protein K1719_023462 [Acacia pycnantha]|nr:hypothetical protein K1719_023462 [Acacia pycnantha]